MQAQAGVIGIIGAGTMGAGIALVALQAGYQVSLYDVQTAMLERAKQEITKRLQRLVDKHKISATEMMKAVERLGLGSDLHVMEQATVVIEAIPERMALKAELFTQLDKICSNETILATNTSSLSITVLAAKTARPDKVIGFHFFNPAPVMKLVEVIVGGDTSTATVEQMVTLAKSFGKEPAVCKDTPGFIVNRVARNYYGESLRIVGEGTATIADVDALLVQGAGFRMGPFRLMDLIGIDVNFDVTKAVYNAYHQEPRYRPHVLQERMVESGRLGQKTGRGFYEYGNEDSSQAPDTASRVTKDTTSRTYTAVVVGDTPLADALRQRIADISGRTLERSGCVYATPLREWDEVSVKWRSDEIMTFLRSSKPDIVFVAFADDEACQRYLLQSIESALKPGTVIATSLAGPSATRQASWLKHPERVRGFNVLLPVQAGQPQLAEWSRPLQAEASIQDEVLVGTLAGLGFGNLAVRDGAGGVQMRVLAMVLNEAAEAIREQVATAADVDIAMTLGTNYPHGPAKWADMLGIHTVLRTLEALCLELGDDRYRPSALLRQMNDAGRVGQSCGQGWFEYSSNEV